MDKSKVGLALALIMLAIGLMCFAQPVDLGPPAVAAPQILRENAGASLQQSEADGAIAQFASGPQFAEIATQPGPRESGFIKRTREAGETKFPLQARLESRSLARGAL
jgi:hypothetical protein